MCARHQRTAITHTEHTFVEYNAINCVQGVLTKSLLLKIDHKPVIFPFWLYACVKTSVFGQENTTIHGALKADMM